MPISRSVQVALTVLAFVAWPAVSPAAEPAPDRVFRISFDESVHKEAYSGRVYVFFSKGDNPRLELDWFHPQPVIAKDLVESLAPEGTVGLSVSDSAAHELTAPDNLDADSLIGLKAQAVIRFNNWEREVAKGEGNGFSDAVVVPASGDVRLVVNQLVPVNPPRDGEWCKLLRVRSMLLSDFHQGDVHLQAAVRLPRSYHTEVERRYPVVFEVPGFGGTLKDMWADRPYAPPTEGNVEFIHVMLDANFPTGHHVFADSANNGPVGEALIKELIPAFEKAYRTVAAPHGRFLTGHSSGGWSSLWLQVAYPEFFGGTWSTSPDSVDFRDFQRIDMYVPGENMYRDEKGERRPIARIGGRPALWYDGFCRIEDVLGHGGQLHSFEAVFSPRGDDGRPALAWNRETGEVDTAVTEGWKKYDIRLILEQDWPALGPKLAGKIHVFMGSEDTFYLEGATRLLKESLEKLGSDAVVEIHEGKDHGTLLSRELRARITREMSQAFLKAKK